jgi:hypothetical protein
MVEEELSPLTTLPDEQRLAKVLIPLCFFPILLHYNLEFYLDFV